MSGTSGDGLDLAVVSFPSTTNESYQLIEGITLPYPPHWQKRLTFQDQISGSDLLRLNHDYGVYTANLIKEYLRQTPYPISLIALHGHTYLHQPALGITYQLGCGPEVSQICGITTVSDFRTADVSLGGQGAPLVPIGDKFLFAEYDGCLNLGGFANLSILNREPILACDLAPANLIMNHLSKREGLPFDKDGEIAAQGQIIPQLLETLRSLPYFREKPPKSLGREWLEVEFLPLFAERRGTTDLMATAVAFLVEQVTEYCQSYGLQRVLVTGGGAFNRFLIQQLQQQRPKTFEIPGPKLIEYKEALLFAWLGMRRIQEKINVWASVTGAAVNHSAGIVHKPPL